MKAVLCLNCTDILAPFRQKATRAWRWCQCDRTGVRWRDGTKGLLEVTCADGPADVRVIGFNNQVLVMAASGLAPRSAEEWRIVHDVTCAEVEPYYLFHRDKRNCWAVIIAPGETGDVFMVGYDTARAQPVA